ncbi:MAG: AAA family ATPase [Myxococcota bacterium]|nr:AAA family ATPase [Myxococcota bacterium]
MYTDFFGLREKPFALSPDPRYLFLSGSHREALAHLLYGIEEGEGFIAITGEVGTGKTTLCRTLIERLGSETEVAFLFNPIGSGLELLQAIAREFGLDAENATRAELNDRLNRFLLEKKSRGQRVLLIVDEAQDLSAETLEEIRLLSNLETSSSKLIQILLLGQPELARKLDSSELRQLRQRIGVRWNLGSLSSRETRDYVRHRLRVAGVSSRHVFSDSALRLVHRRTQGVPRLINVLCDRSLLAAFAAEKGTVTPSVVRRAAREVPDTQPRVLQPVSVLLGLSGGFLVAGVAAWVVFEFGEPAGSSVAENVHPPLPAVSSPPPALAGISPAPLDLESPGGAEEPAEVSPPEPPAEPLEPPGVALGNVLLVRDEGRARLQAVNSALEFYGLVPFRSAPASLGRSLAQLSQRGLTVLEMQESNLSTLGNLNHPALLELVAGDGSVRLATLGRLHPEGVSLYGPMESRPVRVSFEELGEYWNGRAWVIWQSFEPIPSVMVRGERGSGVAWLQTALAELGYYQGETSGSFDEPTFEGVRAFQVNHAIEADGAVGPRTQMLLYDLLDRYPIPRLSERSTSG